MKEKTKIGARVVADSVDPRGNRLTSCLVVMPRIIIAEINTHRMLSKNTSSSRAIPFKKMVEAVRDNPFIPIAWQEAHSGMQGSNYYTDEIDIKGFNQTWLGARDMAVESATELDNGVDGPEAGEDIFLGSKGIISSITKPETKEFPIWEKGEVPALVINQGNLPKFIEDICNGVKTKKPVKIIIAGD